MKTSAILLCAISCLYHVILTEADVADLSYDLKTQDGGLQNGRNMFVLKEGDVPPFPMETDKRLGDDGDLMESPFEDPDKLEEKRFSPRQDSGLNGFWKRRDNQMGFWKRAGFDKTQSGFWKRYFSPSGATSKFWKRAEMADDDLQKDPGFSSLHKRAYNDGADSFWKRGGNNGYGTSRFGGVSGGDGLSGFWKRAGGVPWNLIILPNQLKNKETTKSKPENVNALPPMNRRKGPRANPDFNPTGW